MMYTSDEAAGLVLLPVLAIVIPGLLWMPVSDDIRAGLDIAVAFVGLVVAPATIALWFIHRLLRALMALLRR